jgi:hypothetical protein
MVTIRGPHIPYKEWFATDAPDPTHDHMNWLEVERWAARLNEQLGSPIYPPWIHRTYGDFGLPIGDWSSYPTLTADGNGKFYLYGGSISGGGQYLGGTNPEDFYTTDTNVAVNIIAAGAYQVHVRVEVLIPATHAAMWLSGYAVSSTDKWALDTYSIPAESYSPLLIQPLVFTGTFVTQSIDLYTAELWEWRQGIPPDYTVKIRNAAIHILRLGDEATDAGAT